jgi:hypothetical protein
MNVIFDSLNIDIFGILIQDDCIYKLETNVQFDAVSSTQFLGRPIAGSQVPFCPAEKAMPRCWFFIEPSNLYLM